MTACTCLCGSVQKWNPGAYVPRRSDPEQEWREKLLGECQDEFFETFGQYDDGTTRQNFYFMLSLNVFFNRVRVVRI